MLRLYPKPAPRPPDPRKRWSPSRYEPQRCHDDADGRAPGRTGGGDGAVRAILESAWVAGQGKALFLLGEAGLGKTTLLERAVELAGGRMAVGVGRADVAEAALPFGLLGQALEPLLGARCSARGASRPRAISRLPIGSATGTDCGKWRSSRC